MTSKQKELFQLSKKERVKLTVPNFSTTTDEEVINRYFRHADSTLGGAQVLPSITLQCGLPLL